MKIIITIIALLSASCIPPSLMEDRSEKDSCLEDKLFKECLAAIPKGPTTVVNNDWDDVVDSCRAAAASMSYRKRKHIPDSCRE